MQYRLRRGFVYELENSRGRMSFHISRAGQDAGDLWQIGAQPGRVLDGEQVSESAPTSSEALRKVEASWLAGGADLGLTRSDWAGIESALSAVRAI